MAIMVSLPDEILSSDDKDIARNILEHFRLRAENASRVLEMSRPDRALALRHERFALLQERFGQASNRFLEKRLEHLKTLDALLHTLGPEETFARGFSMTLDAKGNTITDATAVKKGDALRTRVAEGEIKSVVEE